MSNARNILNNFGYWKVAKNDINDELSKNGLNPHMETIDFETIKQIVSYRWEVVGVRHRVTAGRENEGRECFRIFDKK